MTNDEISEALAGEGYTVPWEAVWSWANDHRKKVETWLAYRARFRKNELRCGRPVQKPAILKRYKWAPPSTVQKSGK